MKTIKLILFLHGILFFATNTISAQSQIEDDDMYFSLKDAAAEQEAKKAARMLQPTQPQLQPENNTSEAEDYTKSSNQKSKQNYSSADNYDADDYYDYAYAARIRRFNRPIVTYNYYDPFYTNTYWYNYDPYYYGTSIYLSYSWWNPSPWGCSPTIGWGTSYWYTPNYGYNYYNSGWGGYENSYWSGYNHGYSNGYWNGFNNGIYGQKASGYYYNSYDPNSTYYGHRSSNSSNGRSRESFPETYQRSMGRKAHTPQMNEIEPTRVPIVKSDKTYTKTEVVSPSRTDAIQSVERNTINPNSVSTPTDIRNERINTRNTYDIKESSRSINHSPKPIYFDRNSNSENYSPSREVKTVERNSAIQRHTETNTYNRSSTNPTIDNSQRIQNNAPVQREVTRSATNPNTYSPRQQNKQVYDNPRNIQPTGSPSHYSSPGIAPSVPQGNRSIQQRSGSRPR